MIPRELLRKVRRIEITTSRLVTDVFAGEYHSVFKGQGIEFEEVREYQTGDDIRTIDRNVTARTGKPHVKKYMEERELTVMILVDLSASCRFASRQMFKSQLATEIAATLAFAAIRNNDRVGLMIVTDRVEKFIPPRKGLQHVLRIIREVLGYEPRGRATDIAQALEYLNRVARRKTVAFIISDFLSDATPAVGKGSEDFKKILSVTNKHHDVIAVTLNDRRETEMPECGIIALQDAESGEVTHIDSSSREIRERYQRDNASRLQRRKQLFQSVGIDQIDLYTDTAYSQALAGFFMKRRRKRMLRV
ncbi:MAG: DUF58 domain-containing protein [Candidatus Omnitrophica bacterium]|nr:DUF58 domain-containing protein [Candidatus Omnitrophota bacterium]